MALKIHYTHKHGKVTMRSGHFYKIGHYQAWQNDKSPHIIFLNKYSGTHPKTGRQWRFIQAINLAYCSRTIRKQFVKDWIATYSKSKDIKFTWETVKRKYPYLKLAIRRYFYSPNYYIRDVEALDTIKKIEKTIVGNWYKDFSKTLGNKLGKTMRKWFK